MFRIEGIDVLFFFEFLPQCKFFFSFLPAYLLALRAFCGYFIGPYTLFPPSSLLLPTCSHLLSPSLPAYAIIAYSGVSPASTYFITYFHHRHLLLLAFAYFITCFCHRHLLSLASTIIAYSRLLPQLPHACSQFPAYCHLLPSLSPL
jgi:hypothetical protein